MNLTSKAQAMSGAGLLVVGTLCLSLLLALVTVCLLVLNGEPIPAPLETIVGGLLVGVPALLAKTYRDVAPEPTQEPTPVEVISSPEAPVVTTEVAKPVEEPVLEPVPEVATPVPSSVSVAPEDEVTQEIVLPTGPPQEAPQTLITPTPRPRRKRTT